MGSRLELWPFCTCLLSTSTTESQTNRREDWKAAWCRRRPAIERVRRRRRRGRIESLILERKRVGEREGARQKCCTSSSWCACRVLPEPTGFLTLVFLLPGPQQPGGKQQVGRAGVNANAPLWSSQISDLLAVFCHSGLLFVSGYYFCFFERKLRRETSAWLTPTLIGTSPPRPSLIFPCLALNRIIFPI